MPRFEGHTDTEEEFQLQSLIVDAFWHENAGYLHGVATLEVHTLYVSPGSPIQIQLKTKEGKPLEKVRGQVCSNTFRKKIPITAGHSGGIYFEANLPEHGLSATGPILKIPGSIRLSNPKWRSAGTDHPVTRLRREMDVEAEARVEGVPEGTDGRIVFMEKLTEKKNHKIVSIPCQVKEGRLKANWKFEYPRETHLLGSQHEKKRTAEKYRAPKIFFEAICHGAKVQSSQADFVDWIKIRIQNAKGQPIPGQRIKATLADGSIQEVVADDKGIAHIEEAAPGNTLVEWLRMSPSEEKPGKSKPSDSGSSEDVATESAPEKDAIPQPAPAASVPPPAPLATPPRIKGPIRIWVNAFIPGDIKGYSQKIRKGEFAGKSAIPIPWQIRPDGFLLTDGRSFTESSSAKSRFKTWISIGFKGSLPVIEDQFSFCDTLLEIPELESDQSQKEMAKPDRILWHGFTGDTDRMQISLEARAKIPLLADNSDVLFKGTFTLDLAAMTLAFSGRCSVFPAFEAYVRVRKGPVNKVLQEPIVAGATPWDLMDGMKRSLEIGAKELSI